VDAQGVVSGLYTNGERVPVAQLVVATFRANSGLGRAGDGVWIATRESGSAALGAAGTGRASVSQGSLEQSNVDLGEQFVGLIGHQRAFQANSKVISTADDMLAELVALKR
jgi:flagellar hook protein FlgE